MLKVSIVLALSLAALIALSLAPVYADGAQPQVQTQTQTQDLTGRGPGEAAAVIGTASVSAIEQRGHVANMCEAQVMAQQDISQTGGQQVSGDYKVAYILDPPRGWYAPQNGQLVWRAPAQGETAHIEIVVMDALTGKPVPMTGMTLTVTDQQGRTVQTQPLEYYWHPMADHYGANYMIPSAGSYNLQVQAPPPMIRRHDKNMGGRFAAPLSATFTNVQIAPMSAPVAEMGTAIVSAGAGTTAGVGAGPSRVTVIQQQQYWCPPQPNRAGVMVVPQPLQPCPPGMQPGAGPQQNHYMQQDYQIQQDTQIQQNNQMQQNHGMP